MRHLTAYRVSVSKFDKMCAAGLFDDDRVELLNGVLTMMTSGPGHDFTVTFLRQALEALIPADRWSVREDKPLNLGLYSGSLFPDLAVVRGVHRDFSRRRRQGRLDVALIVEVSDTTYAKDVGIKLRRYERCGVPTYWIVDLNRRRVEVREMGPQGLTVPVLFQEDDAIPLVLDGQDLGRIVVKDLLP